MRVASSCLSHPEGLGGGRPSGKEGPDPEPSLLQVLLHLRHALLGVRPGDGEVCFMEIPSQDMEEDHPGTEPYPVERGDGIIGGLREVHRAEDLREGEAAVLPDRYVPFVQGPVMDDEDIRPCIPEDPGGDRPQDQAPKESPPPGAHGDEVGLLLPGDREDGLPHVVMDPLVDEDPDREIRPRDLGLYCFQAGGGRP